MRRAIPNDGAYTPNLLIYSLQVGAAGGIANGQDGRVPLNGSEASMQPSQAMDMEPACSDVQRPAEASSSSVTNNEIVKHHELMFKILTRTTAKYPEICLTDQVKSAALTAILSPAAMLPEKLQAFHVFFTQRYDYEGQWFQILYESRERRFEMHRLGYLTRLVHDVHFEAYQLIRGSPLPRTYKCMFCILAYSDLIAVLAHENRCVRNPTVSTFACRTCNLEVNYPVQLDLHEIDSHHELKLIYPGACEVLNCGVDPIETGTDFMRGRMAVLRMAEQMIRRRADNVEANGHNNFTTK